MSYSNTELLETLRKLFIESNGSKADIIEKAGEELLWVALTRLESILMKQSKKVMEVGDNPNERWRGEGGWAVVYASEKYEKPSYTEDVYVVKVEEKPGEVVEEVTRSSTGVKKKLRCGCVQQYREQARELRRRLIKEMNLHAANSFADQYDCY